VHDARLPSDDPRGGEQRPVVKAARAAETLARPYYYGIDAVRFASAMMVASFHIGFSSSQPGSRGFSLAGGELHLDYGHWFSWGAIGVEIFFVISGFVIANSANDSTPFRFLRSRAERLYPAVWICAPISLLIWLGHDPDHAVQHLKNFVHTITLFPLGTWVDAPYWTLGHEVVFYGAVFLLILTGNFRRLELFAIAVTLVSAAFWTALIAQNHLGAQIPGLGFFTHHAGRLLLTYYGAFFALGMFIWLHRSSRLGPVGYAAALLAFAVCIVHTSGIEVPGRTTITRLLVWLSGVAAVLAATYFAADDGGRSRRFRLLRDIGLATYPLYLVHFAVGIWTARRLLRLGAPPTLAFLATLAWLALLAFCVAKYAEPVVRRVIRVAFSTADGALASRTAMSRLLHRPGGALTAAAE
jgi:peptidoglycan/LPS O-acetylase OafA/YrhL